jgi:hypothetical protein
MRSPARTWKAEPALENVSSWFWVVGSVVMEAVMPALAKAVLETPAEVMA